MKSSTAKTEIKQTKRRGRPPGTKSKPADAKPKLPQAVLFSPHKAQRQIIDSPARIKIASCGRRFGKTFMALNLLAANALGEAPQSVSWWVAPTYDISQIPFRLACTQFRNFFSKDPSLSDRCLFWINGSRTYFRSTERWQTLVGEGLAFLVIDEAGRVPELAWTESLRPTLIDYKGRALIIGTPKGRNWFYREWLRGQDQEYPEYASWQMPTSANPYIDPVEIELARQSLPELVYQQEFLAEFLAEAAAVFRNVQACAQTYHLPIRPQGDQRYFAGLDLAKYSDFTVLTILDQTGRVVYLDRFNQLDWELQLARIAQTVIDYHAKLVVDSTGVGDPIYERLARAGLRVEPYKFTTETKKRLIEQLILGFERQELTIPAGSILMHELESFEYDIGPTGLVRYAAPPGYHDDCVISLALAWEALGGAVGYTPAVTYKSVQSRTFGGALL